MKTLTDWFDRVYVINCAHRPDRLLDFQLEICDKGLADLDRIVVMPATVGAWTSVPADWKSGGGAWGCLRSHQRVLEDALHARNLDGELELKSILVLEDDVTWEDNALEDLQHFMLNLPEDWGQIYLGGQHTLPATELPNISGVMLGESINRTHAYGVSASCFQAVYRHISYASDYRETRKHVDHQLELAHRRKDWKVYCPEFWLAGQRAGSSDINGRTLPIRFWNP